MNSKKRSRILSQLHGEDQIALMRLVEIALGAAQYIEDMHGSGFGDGFYARKLKAAAEEILKP